MTVASTPTAPATRLRPGAVLIVAAYAAFLATFNETFLNVALTPIMADFGVSSGTVQWVSTAYMLMAAIMVPVTGFLYRTVPTKVLTAVAVALLLAGSLIGLAAPSFVFLLLARIVQALGTGMMVPISMNVVLAVAPRNKMGTYMGLVSAMTTLGPAFGPIVAGAILAVASWHVLFAAFAALVALALALVLALLPNVGVLTHPRLDVVSTCLVCIALVGLLYGLSTVFAGNVTVAVACMLVGLAALAAFVMRQRKIAEPLIDLRPFGNAGFDLGVLLVVIALMVVFSMNILLPLLMQGALGFDALGAALTLLPACILSCVLAPVAGKVYDRCGLRYMAPVGLALIAVFTCLLSTLDASATSLHIVLFYAPVIIGTSLVMGPAQSFALSRLEPQLYPHGVTIVSTAFQVAGCVGSSLFVGVMSGVQAGAIASGADAIGGVVQGFSTAALVACGVGVLGFVLAVCAGIIEARTIKAQKRVARPSGSVSHEVEHAAVAPTANGTGTEALPVPSGTALIDAVMKTDVHSVGDTASVFDALECMVANHTSGLPILHEDGTLAGFVADGDIFRALVGGESPKVDFGYVYALWKTRGAFDERIAELKGVPVMELATKRVISVERSSGIEAVCEKLADRRIKKLPVTEGGRVVGTLSRSDLMRYMVASSPVA